MFSETFPSLGELVPNSIREVPAGRGGISPKTLRLRTFAVKPTTDYSQPTTMNYIKHLTGFFEKVANDRVLNPTHVSLYMAIFQFWNCNRFKNPISISRDEVMRISKISSKSTYHKCLKKLHYLGYINYEPSYNPFKGSHVYLFNFSDDLKPVPKSEKETRPKIEQDIGQVNGQVVDKLCTSIGTGSGQAVVSYTNNTNNLNILKGVNENQLTENFEMRQAFGDSEKKINKGSQNENSDLEKEDEGKEKSSAKKENQPTSQEVQKYFQDNSFPELEAQKFFNYFSSNGWLVGGKTPMVDWQAAAQNWMLNANKFISYGNQHNRAENLSSSTDKDYSEPL
jgi:hypothetical protein